MTELGLFVKCPQPEMIEAIGIAGMDFAVIDMEHTPLGPRDLYPLVLAAERRKLKTVIRIPENKDTYIKWCRDLNVSAIQIPHVETAEDAIYAMKHSFFQPSGERGLCRFVRAADFSGMSKDEYIRDANGSNQLILQIEGLRALPNLPKILDVIEPGVSIFIGPYDLSQSMGMPGQIWNDVVVGEMQRIVEMCQKKHVKVGTFTDTPEGIGFWADKGVSFIEYASDLHLFMNAARELKSHV